jgi:hypothetical protein
MQKTTERGFNTHSEIHTMGAITNGMVRATHYDVVCHDAEGNELWRDQIENTITNEGLNHSLDCQFKTGYASPAWYMGLTDGTPTVAAADTLSSHGGWTEITAYSGDRKAVTFTAVSSQSTSNTGNENQFTMTGSATVGGMFLATAETGTSGVLYGGGAFTGGDRSLNASETITVTVTLSASDAG